MYSREESQTCQRGIEGLGRLREQVRFARSKEKSTAFYPVPQLFILCIFVVFTGGAHRIRCSDSVNVFTRRVTNLPDGHRGVGPTARAGSLCEKQRKSTAFYPVHLRWFYWRSTQDSVQWLGECIHEKSHKPARRASKGWADCESRFALREAKKKAQLFILCFFVDFTGRTCGALLAHPLSKRAH